MPTKKQPKHYANNEAFVRHLMNFGPTGAMMQLFIMDAIKKQADAVKNASLADLGPENGLISPQAWRQTAKYIADEFDKYFAKR